MTILVALAVIGLIIAGIVTLVKIFFEEVFPELNSFQYLQLAIVALVAILIIATLIELKIKAGDDEEEPDNQGFAVERLFPIESQI